MFRRAKLRREQQGARFALAEKLVLEENPGDTRVRVTQHCRLLEVAVDGAVDPGEHGAVHLHPHRLIGVDHVDENVIG